jgi:hypothetical protein
MHGDKPLPNALFGNRMTGFSGMIQRSVCAQTWFAERRAGNERTALRAFSEVSLSQC